MLNNCCSTTSNNHTSTIFSCRSRNLLWCSLDKWGKYATFSSKYCCDDPTWRKWSLSAAAGFGHVSPGVIFSPSWSIWPTLGHNDSRYFQISEPQYLFASATVTSSIFKDTGHWNIRPILASIQVSPSFIHTRVAHINMCFNVKAHHQAKLAINIKNRRLAFWMSLQTYDLVLWEMLSPCQVRPFTLLFVKCFFCEVSVKCC